MHRSGRTGRAGKLGTAILMYTSNQRRTVRSLERDVGCKFEYISPPSVEEILESSVDQVVSTLGGVHSECIEFFTPTAQKLIDQQGTVALAAALAHMSGFAQLPSSKSLLSHEQVIDGLRFSTKILSLKKYKKYKFWISNVFKVCCIRFLSACFIILYLCVIQ